MRLLASHELYLDSDGNKMRLYISVFMVLVGTVIVILIKGVDGRA